MPSTKNDKNNVVENIRHSCWSNSKIGGTPDALKGACPVWTGGKDGDYIKILPIGIPRSRLCSNFCTDSIFESKLSAGICSRSFVFRNGRFQKIDEIRNNIPKKRNYDTAAGCKFFNV